ncbi:MAG: hypothetical protein KF788_21865 [Piscinibacter sp.]|nr:hypothetical protein [Piscinibacter sp.]
MTALRIDFLHRGTPRSEAYAIAGWAASTAADPHCRGRLDPRGGYRWSLLDAGGGVLASRGYSTLLEEWQSTVVGHDEGVHGEFRETHCVPWVAGALLRVERRGARHRFETLFEQRLPAAAEVPPVPAPPPRTLRWLHGDGTLRPILFVSEGYTADEGEVFFDRARHAAGLLMAASPFAEQRDRLAVAALHVPSPASGIPAEPGEAVAGTAFGTHYGTFGMARYMVAEDLHALHRAVDGIGHVTLILLANSTVYGGSGIFNSNASLAAHMDEADFAYVLPHELGHSLGGLGDEYFGKEITYSTDPDEAGEAWEPNVSALDAAGRPKWAAQIDAGMPVPSPWRHGDFLALLASGTPAAEQRAQVADLLGSEPLRGRVGAFEGARYVPKGMYRPEVDCRMFSKTAPRLCAVCQQAMVEVLDEVVRQA